MGRNIYLPEVGPLILQYSIHRKGGEPGGDTEIPPSAGLSLMTSDRFTVSADLRSFGAGELEILYLPTEWHSSCGSLAPTGCC